METPTTKDGTPLKRVQLDNNTSIYVLPHVSEEATIEKFKNRRDRADWSTIGALSNSYGSKNISNKGFGSDY